MSAAFDFLNQSNEENTRVNVAACYRLLHHYGLSDLTDGFASARIQDGPSNIVIGGYGALPELITASSLFVRSIEHQARLEKVGGVDLDAVRFSKTVYEAKSDSNACIHAHPEATIALSSLDVELMPCSQWGIMYAGRVAYLDFNTTDVTSPGQCKIMRELMVDGVEAIILRNHGILAAGRTIAQAFFTVHRIELASRIQLAVMNSGVKPSMPSGSKVSELQESYWSMTRVDNDGSREWAALRAKLDLLDASYKV